MKLLLDTCAMLWAVGEPDLLSSKVREFLTDEGNQIFISPISCAEIACAVERERIKLDRHWKIWFRHFTKLNGWKSIAIDNSVVAEAYSLQTPFHKDPADRVLVATARLNGAALVTADERILNYPHVESVW